MLNVKRRVLSALYGLVTSPRSWSVFRDKRLRGFAWKVGEDRRVMRPCISDPNIWKVINPDTCRLVALVACYVDDILIVGPLQERKSFLDHLKTVWDCSVPEHTEQGPVDYCGLEVTWSPEGLRITQEKYVQELLQRQ